MAETSGGACDSCSDLSSATAAGKALQATATMLNSSTANVDAHITVNVRADLLFSVLARPDLQPVVFQAVEGSTWKLVAREGPWCKYEVDCKARWRFWKVSGVAESKVYLEAHADTGTVSFKLREPGFLKVYEGTWVIKPLGHPALNMYTRQQANSQPAPATLSAAPGPGSLLGALASLHLPALAAPSTPAPAPATPYPAQSTLRLITKMSPKIAPPFPFGGLLKGQLLGQVEAMLRDVVAYAEHLQNTSVGAAAAIVSTDSSRVAATHGPSPPTALHLDQRPLEDTLDAVGSAGSSQELVRLCLPAGQASDL